MPARGLGYEGIGGGGLSLWWVRNVKMGCYGAFFVFFIFDLGSGAYHLIVKLVLRGDFGGDGADLRI